MRPRTPPPAVAAPRAAATTRHRRWYRGPIVRGRRRVFGRFRVALAASRSRVRCGVALRSPPRCSRGCGGGAARTPHEPQGTFTRAGRPGELPRPSVDRAADARSSCAVRNTGTQTVPNVAVTIDSLRLRRQLPRTGRRQAPDLGRSNRAPGAIAKPPVAEPGGQPARRRPDGLRQHLGARPARARAHADVHLARRPGEGRACTRPLHGRRRPRRQGHARSSPPARPATGHFVVAHRRRAPGHARRTRTPARSIPGAYPHPRPQPVAPAAPARARRVWPAVERSLRRFRHAVMPFGRLAHYDCPSAFAPDRSRRGWRARARPLALPEEESTPPMPQDPPAERHRRAVERQRLRARLARPDPPGQPGLRRRTSSRPPSSATACPSTSTRRCSGRSRAARRSTPRSPTRSRRR